MDKAIEKIEWLQDVFVTRREEQGFEVFVTIKDAFTEVLQELQAYKAKMEEPQFRKCPPDCKQQDHCLECSRLHADQYAIQLRELDK